MSQTQLDEHLVQDDSLRVDMAIVAKMNDTSFAAIDMGSTLTKIFYTEEVGDGKGDLHFATFRNKHFESAIRYLKEKLQPNSDCRIHVTGVGSNLHGNKIKEILGVDHTVFIDEALSQFVGFHFLLRHFPLENICHPAPECNDPIFDQIQRGETFQRIRDARVALMKEQATGEKFPCLYAIFGSSAGVALVREDGSIEVKHRHLLAGKSFLGACQLLIGTSDYRQILDMAAAGNRGNIDTQVRDILADSPNSPYGNMPPTLPLFAFGKAVDFDKSLEDCRPEDIAQSLASSFITNFINVVTFLAGFERVRNVFFGGNFFQHEFARTEVVKHLKFFGSENVVSVNFLKTGHTAALGAALSSENDAADFFANMKVAVGGEVAEGTGECKA